MKAIEITVMDQAFVTRSLSFAGEDELIAYLVDTHSTEALLSITGLDGQPAKRDMIDRIQEKVFSALFSDDPLTRDLLVRARQCAETGADARMRRATMIEA